MRRIYPLIKLQLSVIIAVLSAVAFAGEQQYVPQIHDLQWIQNLRELQQKIPLSTYVQKDPYSAAIQDLMLRHPSKRPELAFAVVSLWNSPQGRDVTLHLFLSTVLAMEGSIVEPEKTTQFWNALGLPPEVLQELKREVFDLFYPSLQILSRYLIAYDVKYGWVSGVSGQLRIAELEQDPQVRLAFLALLGEDLLDPSRNVARQVGELVFLPPQNEGPAAGTLTFMPSHLYRTKVLRLVHVIEQEFRSYAQNAQMLNTYAALMSPDYREGNSPYELGKDGASQTLHQTYQILKTRYGVTPVIRLALLQAIQALVQRDGELFTQAMNRTKWIVVGGVLLPAAVYVGMGGFVAGTAAAGAEAATATTVAAAGAKNLFALALAFGSLDALCKSVAEQWDTRNYADVKIYFWTRFFEHYRSSGLLSVYFGSLGGTLMRGAGLAAQHFSYGKHAMNLLNLTATGMAMTEGANIYMQQASPLWEYANHLEKTGADPELVLAYRLQAREAQTEAEMYLVGSLLGMGAIGAGRLPAAP